MPKNYDDEGDYYVKSANWSDAVLKNNRLVYESVYIMTSQGFSAETKTTRIKGQDVASLVVHTGADRLPDIQLPTSNTLEIVYTTFISPSDGQTVVANATQILSYSASFQKAKAKNDGAIRYNIFSNSESTTSNIVDSLQATLNSLTTSKDVVLTDATTVDVEMVSSTLINYLRGTESGFTLSSEYQIETELLNNIANEITAQNLGLTVTEKRKGGHITLLLEGLTAAFSNLTLLTSEADQIQIDDVEVSFTESGSGTPNAEPLPLTQLVSEGFEFNISTAEINHSKIVYPFDTAAFSGNSLDRTYTTVTSQWTTAKPIDSSAVTYMSVEFSPSFTGCRRRAGCITCTTWCPGR